VSEGGGEQSDTKERITEIEGQKPGMAWAILKVILKMKKNSMNIKGRILEGNTRSGEGERKG
jgi:hypothetical protein